MSTPGMSQELALLISRIIGRFALLATPFVIMFFFTAFDKSIFMTHRQEPAQPVVVTNDGLQTLEVSRSKNGHFEIPVTINGVLILGIVDTGASLMSISTRAAQRAGLRPQAKGKVSTANGVRDAFFGRADRIEMGPFTIRHAEVSWSEGMNHMASHGLIGMGLLDSFDMRIERDTLFLTASSPR
jgi:aspartyl protease family protein